MNIAAFFDLDGTIIKGTSGLRFMRYLYSNKILKAKSSTIIPSLRLAYSYLRGDYLGAVDQADNLLAIAMKGLSSKVVRKAAQVFAKIDSKNFNDSVIRKIEWHRQQGHKLILLSVTQDELAKSFGKILKFDYSIGSRLTKKEGIYEGNIVHPSMIGKERAAVAKRIAKKLKINLAKSFAYGNCINDLEVLELTGNPFAVNPNKHLLAVARKKGFRII